jgi:hypothetical protein
MELSGADRRLLRFYAFVSILGILSWSDRGLRAKKVYFRTGAACVFCKPIGLVGPKLRAARLSGYNSNSPYLPNRTFLLELTHAVSVFLCLFSGLRFASNLLGASVWAKVAGRRT